MQTNANTDSYLNKVIEKLQRHAKVCETAAQDATEEALTGESCEKEKNEQDAQLWLMKAQIWRDAEAIVRGESNDRQ